MCFINAILLKKYNRAIKLFFLGIGLPVFSLIYYYLKFDSISEFLVYWHLKGFYRKEFLPLTSDALHRAFEFLAGKPQIFLGLIALGLRLRIKRSDHDGILGIFQALLLVGFMFSVGFDRFGLWLIPISSLFLAEWFQFLWNKSSLQFKDWMLRLFHFWVLVLFFVLNGQNMYFTLIKSLITEPNTEEKAVAKWINQNLTDNQSVFIYDLSIIPFLNQSIKIKLPQNPPILANIEPKPVDIQFLVEGPYSRTEYYVNPMAMDFKKVYQSPDKIYSIWQKANQ